MTLEILIEQGIHQVISAAVDRVARQADSAEEAANIPFVMIDLEMKLMQTNRTWFAEKVSAESDQLVTGESA